MWLFGKKAREQLEEKQKEIDFLRDLTHGQEERLKEVEGKIKVMVDALADAQAKTGTLVEDASRKAEELLSEARARADAVLAEAKEKAEEVRLGAKVDAENTVRESREKSERLVRAAKLEAARYEETVEAYNRLVEESAAQAIRNSEMYAELIKNHKLNATRVELEASGPEETAVLPDADGDPAQLMRNIYRLQNRDIPDVTRREEPEIPGLFGREDAASGEPDEIPTVSAVLGGAGSEEKEENACADAQAGSIE